MVALAHPRVVRQDKPFLVGHPGFGDEYELTLFKRYCRWRCRTNCRSGFQFGLYCVGSSIGLMVMLVALGVMSVTWMSVVAVLVVVQKLLPPRASIDVPLALAILALGIVIAVAPSSIPGLSPTM
jgi:predicted metal-binding membrane protein